MQKATHPPPRRRRSPFEWPSGDCFFWCYKGSRTCGRLLGGLLWFHGVSGFGVFRFCGSVVVAGFKFHVFSFWCLQYSLGERRIREFWGRFVLGSFEGLGDCRFGAWGLGLSRPCMRAWGFGPLRFNSCEGVGHKGSGASVFRLVDCPGVRGSACAILAS